MLRILPRMNDDVNEEWIGDKSRIRIDGLKRRRLDRPWVRRDGKLQPATWPEAFAAIAARLRGLPGERIGAIAGDLCDAESMVALKDLMAALGSANLDCRQDGARLDATRREFYLFNTGDRRDRGGGRAAADRQQSAPRGAGAERAHPQALGCTAVCPIGAIGPPADLTYPARISSATAPALLNALHDGSDGFAQALREAKRPMIIVGQGALARPDGAAVLAAAWRLAAAVGALGLEWHGFNVLHTAAARVGALDLGFLPGAGRQGHRRRCWAAASICCGCSAPTSSTPRASARTPSSSIRAITATAAPRAPT